MFMAYDHFLIRRGGLADAPAIVEYNRRLAEETEGLRLDPTLLLSGVLGALADESQALYFVAEIGLEIAGQVMVTFEWSDWRNGSIWWLQSVYVAPEWRRQGIFRALYDHVLHEGREAGAACFRLYVEKENSAAQEVYRRLGLRLAPYLVMESLPEER